MNKKQINNNNNDQVLDGYVIKLRLIVELHITHSRLENIRWYQWESNNRVHLMLKNYFRRENHSSSCKPQSESTEPVACDSNVT